MTQALGWFWQTTAPDLWGGLIAAVLVVLGFHWLARRRDRRLERAVQDLVGTLQETGRTAWGHMESTNALVRATGGDLRKTLDDLTARAGSLERGQEQAGAALAQVEARLNEGLGRVAGLPAALADLRQRAEGTERHRVNELQALGTRTAGAERVAEEAAAGAKALDQRARDAEAQVASLGSRIRSLEERAHDYEASIQVLLAAGKEGNSHLRAEIQRLAERLEHTASDSTPPAPPATDAGGTTPEAHAVSAHVEAAGATTRPQEDHGGLMALALLLGLAAAGLFLGLVF